MAKFLRQSFFTKSSKDQSIPVDIDDYAEPRPQNNHDEERSKEAAQDKIEPVLDEAPPFPTTPKGEPTHRSKSSSRPADKKARTGKTEKVKGTDEKSKTRPKRPEKTKCKTSDKGKSVERTKTSKGSRKAKGEAEVEVCTSYDTPDDIVMSRATFLTQEPSQKKQLSREGV